MNAINLEFQPASVLFFSQREYSLFHLGKVNVNARLFVCPGEVHLIGSSCFVRVTFN